MVSALHRKLFRELRRQRAQVLSIALLVACGMIAVIGMRSAYDSLRVALDAYYRDYRFGAVFASLTRAPESLAHRIREIDGVSAVQTRVVGQATLAVRGLDGPATGLLVSAPDLAGLNALHLFRGRHVDPLRDDEVIASTRFAAENGLVPGDTISAIVHGRRHRMRVVGIASSPDYLYEIATTGFFADQRRFGVLWMPRTALAAATRMEGAFNAVSVSLAPRASEDRVIEELDRLLGRYGGVGAIARADQPSNMVLQDELGQLRATATVFPLFFLGIAAFLLNVVLSRLIATQRDEIGSLKSFGYTNGEVGLHYLGFALAAVGLGAAIGVAGGIWLGRVFTGLYDNYFGFPNLVYRTYPLTIVAGVGVSGGAALAGALWAVRSAVRLAPAQAMRPEAPARFRQTVLERLGVGDAVSLGVRMAMRTLERRPVRTGASIAGIGLACAVLIAGLYPYDAVERMISLYFERAQREDLSLSFSAPRPARVRHDLAAIAGVTRVELTRVAAVRLRNAQRERSVAIQGVEATAELRRFIGADGGLHALPAGGLVVTKNLARALDVRAGEELRVELLERALTRRVVVAGILDESIGLAAYMERRALNRLLSEGDVATGGAITVRPGSEHAVAATLRDLPQVAGIASRAALLDYFKRTFADVILVSASVVIFAAVVIAVGVVYNGARIAIAERTRDLASLRVLGFTRREVSGFFLGEQGLITAAGLPLGAAFGLAFAAILASAFATERHRFPVFVETKTYLLGVVTVAVTAALVALVVRRHVDRLDLIAALKTGD
jgi:putative ABC transport system permease protein